MKAISFDGTLKHVTDSPIPEPGDAEALIRVSLAGICNTDLEIVKGYLGFQGVLGHEFVGVVEAAKGRARGLIGRRVVGEINCGCGLCVYCLRGLEKHCPGRKTLGIVDKDGAFAEYLTLPVGNLWQVPNNVTDEEAVFTEPLAAAFEILEQMHIRPTDRVLVLGDGKLGILSALVLNLTGAEVTLAGKHKEKLRIAREQSVQVAETSRIELKRDYDVVVEATGSADGFDLALRAVKPRGAVVLKTTAAQGKEINLAPLVIDEIQVVGSRCGPFAPALRALSNKSIDVKPLITGLYRADRAIEAFAEAASKNSLKVLLDLR
jgi:threonine dehydrogenase-like Zn-dependent dehydrogenase